MELLTTLHRRIKRSRCRFLGSKNWRKLTKEHTLDEKPASVVTDEEKGTLVKDNKQKKGSSGSHPHENVIMCLFMIKRSEF